MRGEFVPPAWFVACSEYQECGALVDWCQPREPANRKFHLSDGRTMCFPCQDRLGIAEYEEAP